jgi:hypothetical protein
MPQYALLLYSRPDHADHSPRQIGSPVQRDADWIEDLKRRGLYVASFRLAGNGGRHVKPEHRGLVARDATHSVQKSVIDSVFVVEAEDTFAAEWIARESPHLIGQNFIEIRAVHNKVHDAVPNRVLPPALTTTG